MIPFYDMKSNEIEKLLPCLEAKTITFQKGSTILNTIKSNNNFYILLKGSANVIQIDKSGNRTIIETLKTNDVFESRMFHRLNNEIFIIALEETQIIVIHDEKIFIKCQKNCPYHTQFINNILTVLIKKINSNYLHVHFLTKKTIREKILEYFYYIAKIKKKKNFTLPMKYSDLADYLSTDRSALMREIKKLKEENIIEIKNKVVTIKKNP